MLRRLIALMQSTQWYLRIVELIDAVSGNSQTDTSAGIAGYLDATDTYVEVAATVPLITQRGNTSAGAYTQYLATPLTPANQTTASLGTGEYFLWIRGGGSVEVAANSATITGAGSATQATGVNFQVTVAGTVDVAITGECTRFQLTTGNVSLYPLFYNTTGTIASRSGTTRLPTLSTSFPKFYDALDGVADGSEIVVDLTFSNWAAGDLVSWSETRCDADEDGEYAKITLAVGETNGNIFQVYTSFTPGARYRFTGTLKNGNLSTGIRLWFDSSNAANDVEGILVTATSDTDVFINFTAYDGSEPFKIGVFGLAGQYAYVKNISIKQISPAVARHSFTWTPGISYTKWTAVQSILTGSDADYFVQVNATGGMVLDDGTTTATVDIDFTAGTEYPVEVVYGYNTTEAAYKMQLNVYISGSWVTQMENFDQSFNPGTNFIYGLSNTYQSSIKDYKTEQLRQSHWR